MALNLVLVEQTVSPEEAVQWASGQSLENDETEKKLSPYTYLRHDFAPELLNLLRTKTLPIIENGVAQSPAKPSPKQQPQSARFRNREHSGKLKRRALFPAGFEVHERIRLQHLPVDVLERYMFSDTRSEVNTASGIYERNRTPETNKKIKDQQQGRDKGSRSRYDSNKSFMMPSVSDCSFPETRNTFRDASSAVSVSRNCMETHSHGNLKQFNQNKNRNGQQHRPSDTGQSSGRAKHTLTLAEFFNTTPRCVTDSREKERKGCGKKGRKNKNQRRRAESDSKSQQENDYSVSQTMSFSVSSLEDFPPVSPESSENMGSGAVLGNSPNDSRDCVPDSSAVTRHSPEYAPQGQRGAPSPNSTVDFVDVKESKSATNQSAVSATGDWGHSGHLVHPERDQDCRSLPLEHADQTGMVTDDAESLKSNPAEACTPEKPVKVIPLVKASPEEVTHQPQLDLFVRLYSGCMDALLFPNVSVELHFLAQLLIAQASLESDEQNSADSDVENVNVFETVHSVVYFAVEVMARQTELLQQFDQMTLQLLMENERVQAFSPQLHSQLKTLCSKIEDSKNISATNIATSVVAFQVETDNKQNFPSEKSFHRSKIMRDDFYNLKKEWEVYHEELGWDMKAEQGIWIQKMFADADLGAYLHFASLFVSQLLVSCKQELMISKVTEQKADKVAKHEEESAIADVTGTTPDRSAKLTERLTKPTHYGGPCPSPSFRGHQHFFEQFLRIAANSVLNQHVSNVLATRIEELNSMTLSEDTPRNEEEMKSASQEDVSCPQEHSGPEKEEEEEAESERDAFTSALLTLRLLSRFLGLLTYMPYEEFNKLPLHIQQDNIVQRRLVSPPLSLKECLRSAAERGRLALTVPWMVEFLAMMDHGAPSTASIRPVLVDLRQLLKLVWAEIGKSGYTYSRLLIVTSLGWLLDQPCMPPGYYFTGDRSSSSREEAISSISPEFKKFTELVSVDLFYTCCPYFGEMRYLLSQFSLGTRAKTEVRKVNARPPADSTSVKRAVLDSAVKRKQYELMRNLSDVIPKMSQYLVKFISDLISYNYIRDLRHKTLPSALNRCAGENHLLTSIPAIAQRIYSETRNSMLNNMESICIRKIKLVIQMCSSELHKTVLQTMIDMACSLTRIKIKHWIDTCVTYNIFHKHLEELVAARVKCVKYGTSPQTNQLVFHKADTSDSTQDCPEELFDLAEAEIKSSKSSENQLQVEPDTNCIDAENWASAPVPNVEHSDSRLDVGHQMIGKDHPKRVAVTSVKQTSCDQASNPARRISLQSSSVGRARSGKYSSFPATGSGDSVTGAGDRCSVQTVWAGGRLLTGSGDNAIGTRGRRDMLTVCAGERPLTGSGDGANGTGDEGDVQTVWPGYRHMTDPRDNVTGTGNNDVQMICAGDTSLTDCGNCMTRARGKLHKRKARAVDRVFTSSEDRMDVTCTEEPEMTTFSLSDSEHSSRVMLSALRTTAAASGSRLTALAVEENQPVISVKNSQPFTKVESRQLVPIAKSSQHVTADEDDQTATSVRGELTVAAGEHSMLTAAGEGNQLIATDRGSQSVAAETKNEKMRAGLMVYMLQEVQDLLYALSVEKQPIEKSDLHCLIHCVLDAMAKPNEVMKATLNGVILGLNQLAVAIVFLQPSFWTEDTSSLFVKLWSSVAVTKALNAEFSSLCNCIVLGYLTWASDLSLSLQLYCDQLAILIEKDCLTLREIRKKFDEILPEYQMYEDPIKNILSTLSAGQEQ